MNSAQALHNAARCYCIDNYRHWCKVYAAVPKGEDGCGYHYSAKALDTFPRYQILNAIRVAVETVDSDSLADFTSAKSLVVNAGSIADDDFTRNPLGEIATNAQSSEREKFCDFVNSLTEMGVWNYDPLPYRRVLSKAESERVWSSLGSVWGVPARAHWYPLCETSIADIAAFRADAFHEFVPAHALRRKLVGLCIERVWELREYGPEYIEDVELFDPLYNGAEGAWTAPGYPWVIYASHESSLTVAGTLLSEIKRMWPNWQQHKW
jgi:hypothetical protein